MKAAVPGIHKHQSWVNCRLECMEQQQRVAPTLMSHHMAAQTIQAAVLQNRGAKQQASAAACLTQHPCLGGVGKGTGVTVDCPHAQASPFNCEDY